jgi:hypothetical protein
VSRKNEYTNGFIEMNKREQAAWSRAFVRVAIKPGLTMSERRTLCEFERVWEGLGSDFTEDRTYDMFLALCQRHHVPIRFMRKPPDTGRRGEKGAMVEVEWTTPEKNGSYWPPHKDKDGNRRTFEEMRRLKREYRIKVKLAEMARIGISSLTYSSEQIEQVIDRKVGERVREIEPVVESVKAVIESARVESTRRYDDAYELPARLRLIDSGKAA